MNGEARLIMLILDAKFQRNVDLWYGISLKDQEKNLQIFNGLEP